ncbi:MAG: hypothetical protein DSY57_04540 [Desulfobulbus sp.]|nr:MAG: hypothetical protein DSY57_04540 [Desulfobulbus sp.]
MPVHKWYFLSISEILISGQALVYWPRQAGSRVGENISVIQERLVTAYGQGWNSLSALVKNLGVTAEYIKKEISCQGQKGSPIKRILPVK